MTGKRESEPVADVAKFSVCTCSYETVGRGCGGSPIGARSFSIDSSLVETPIKRSPSLPNRQLHWRPMWSGRAWSCSAWTAFRRSIGLRVLPVIRNLTAIESGPRATYALEQRHPRRARESSGGAQPQLTLGLPVVFDGPQSGPRHQTPIRKTPINTIPTRPQQHIQLTYGGNERELR